MSKKTKQDANKPFTFEGWLEESIFETSDRLKEELPEFKELLIKTEQNIAMVGEKLRKVKNPEERNQLYMEESRLYAIIQSTDNKSRISHVATYPVLKDIIESMRADRKQPRKKPSSQHYRFCF